MIYAVILIVMVVYKNAPSLKSFREKYNFKKLTNKLFGKKRLGESSDDEARWDVVPTKIEMNEVLSTDIIVTESVSKPDKGDKS